MSHLRLAILNCAGLFVMGNAQLNTRICSMQRNILRSFLISMKSFLKGHGRRTTKKISIKTNGNQFTFVAIIIKTLAMIKLGHIPSIFCYRLRNYVSIVNICILVREAITNSSVEMTITRQSVSTIRGKRNKNDTVQLLFSRGKAYLELVVTK